MKKSILLFLLLAFASIAGAQTSDTYKLSGTVADSASGVVLPGAAVTLHQNGEQKAGVIAQDLGEFYFDGLQAGTYVMKIQLIGYNSFEAEVKLQSNLVLETVLISQITNELEEVSVQERYAIGQAKGDTTEYNSQAFKTNPNASAQDLIEKMPGMRNDNGTMKAEGEEVQQVLVDGKPFFGQDVKTALGVLPAEAVDKIQVFDDQSEQSKASGVDDGTRIKTVNIVTKINMRNGEFGKVYAGYGTDERYSAGGNINVFRGDRRYSILGQANNVNMQNFSTADLLGVVADNSKGRHHRRGPAFMRGFSVGSDASDFMVNPSNGIIGTVAGGFNYQDEWSEKMEVSASYFFNQSQTTAISSTFEQYFLNEAEGQTYTELDSTESTNTNHRFNAKLTYKLNDKASFYMLPSLTLQQNNGDQNTLGITASEGTVLSSLNSLFNSDYEALSWSNDLMFRQQFEKKGRSAFGRVRIGQQQRNGGSDMITWDGGTLPSLIQNANLDNGSLDLTASIMYSEPLNEKGLNTFLTYDISNSQEKQDQETFDLSIPETPLDSLLSNKYHNDWLTQTFGIGIRKFDRHTGFVLRLKYQTAQLINKQSLPQIDEVKRPFNNILPFAMLRLPSKIGGGFFAMYRSSTNEPSAAQLQQNIDNSNPLQLTQGNPELNQQYSHMIRMRFKAANPEQSTVFYTGAYVTYSNSYMGNETYTARQDETVDGYFLSKGTQLTKPINLSGYWNIRSMVNYGLAVKALKSNLNLDLAATWSSVPSIMNGRQLQTQSHLTEFGVILSSNISEKIDFMISSTSGYNQVNNDLNSELNTNYFVQRSKIKYSWILPMGFTFRTQLEHQQYFGLSEDLNNTVVLWTAGVGKQLFKDNRGEIQLSAFDILGQNNQISQQFQDNYYQESTSNVLSTYLMLSFSYNIRKFREGNE